MLNQLIRFSIQQRFFVMIFALLLIGTGIYNALLLPIDAVPDVTNKQVQINTVDARFGAARNGATSHLSARSRAGRNAAPGRNALDFAVRTFASHR